MSESDTFTCTCGRRLTRKLLRRIVTEQCPSCDAPVHQSISQKVEAGLSQHATDVFILEGLIDAAAAALGASIERDRTGESDGTCRWELSGGRLEGVPDGWVAQVEYVSKASGVMFVRLVTTEPDRVDNKTVDRLLSLVSAAGVQFVMDRSADPATLRGFDMGVSPDQTTVWGVQHALAFEWAGADLFGPVVERLLATAQAAARARVAP